MKSLVLALVMVIYAATSNGGPVVAADYSVLGKGLDGASQRVGRDYQSLSRPQEGAARRNDRNETGRTADAARLTFVNGTNGDSTAVSNAPKAMVAVPQAVNAGWVGCPCKGECKCVTEDICKAGDCKRNYVMLATARWCHACPRQKVVIEQLRKEGYIVHIVDFDANRSKMDALGITTLPTTLVFKDGKVDKTFVGVTRIAQIKDGLLTKAEQPDPQPEPPKPPTYNFKQ